MSDTPTDAPQAPSGNSAAAQPIQPVMKVVGQYIRDLSFENVVAQKGMQGEIQPDVKVQVNLDAKKRPAEDHYEVIVKFVIDSRNKSDDASLFLMELEYGGVFQVTNLTEQQLHPYLMIECPRMLFPFIRRIVSDVTRDGGFPPLNLETIDFLQLYRAELTKRAQAQQSGAAQSADA
ncbi:MAG: protein-export chaperone SecB [Pseudomonadota bacterium]